MVKRKHRLKILIIFCFFLLWGSASFSQYNYRTFTKDGGHNYSFIIKNTSAHPINIKNIFDVFFYTSLEDLITFINKKYPEVNENYVRAWRFMIDYTWNVGIPPTVDEWYHEPLLFINSFGSGLCYDKSVVLAKIWNYWGYKTRVWNLSEEHTVPEIYVNNHWEMYDPTYHCFYSDNSGNVLGVSDIVKQPDYINKPGFHAQRIKSFWSKIMGYSNKTKKIYLKNDNKSFEVSMQEKSSKYLHTSIILPPNSYIILPMYSGLPVERKYPNCEDKSTIAYANLAFYLPAGQTGEVFFPLMFHGAHSKDAVFELYNEKVYLTSESESYFPDTYYPNVRIKISENKNGIWLYYFVNPLLIEKESANIIWDNTDVVIQKVKLSPAQRVVVPYLEDFDKPLDQVFVKLVRYLMRVI